MSNPKRPAGAEVDPSEGSIDEGSERQGFRAAEADDEDSARLEVDPPEGHTG